MIEVGFLAVDKQGGWTSHDVVAKARSLFKMKKIGHAGTLDPMATGLVVLGLGRATRLLRYVQAQPKTYVARAQFGVATDSLDADGSVLSREPMDVTVEDVRGAIPRFVGEIMQVPPMVSALQVDGRRLYDLAREGTEVERSPRPVTIHSLEITDFEAGPYPEVGFEVTCGSGTYIRTLADDLAAALGGRAHLTSLRRTANGGLLVASALTLDLLEAAAEANTLDSHVLSAAEVLVNLPFVAVDPQTAESVSHGVPLSGSVIPDPAHGGSFRVMDEGRLVAVYRTSGDMARPEVVIG